MKWIKWFVSTACSYSLC